MVVQTRRNTSRALILCRLEWRRLWLKSKTQLIIIPHEAPVMNETKAPKIRIKLNIKNDQVGQVKKKIFSHLTFIGHGMCLTGPTSLSHVVGILEVSIYLIVLAVGSVSTAAL